MHQFSQYPAQATPLRALPSSTSCPKPRLMILIVQRIGAVEPDAVDMQGAAWIPTRWIEIPLILLISY